MSRDAFYGATRLFAEQWNSSRTSIDDENNLQASYKLLHGYVNNASTVELKLNRCVVHASMGHLSKNSRQMQNEFCTSHAEIFYYPQNLSFDQLLPSAGTDDEHDLILTAMKGDPYSRLKDHKKKVEEQLKPLVYRMLSKAYRTCSLDFSLFEKYRDKNASVNLACIVNAVSLTLVVSPLHLKAVIVAVPNIKAEPATSITNMGDINMALPEKSSIEAVAGLPTASTFENIRLFAYSNGKCRPISADGNEAVDDEMPSIGDVETSEAQKSALKLLSFYARAARLTNVAERVVEA